MLIWIDADACPRAVKEIIFRAGERTSIPVHLVANKGLNAPTSKHIHMIQVEVGPDVADDYIAKHAQTGDLAVTADIPLAARLVERGLLVLNPRGEEYTANNVRERLSVRDFMSNLREAGVMTGGPRAFEDKDKRRFANALDRILTRVRSSC